MKKNFLPLLLMVFAVGCAQLQPIGGTGRFLQLSTNGRVIAQQDTPNYETCRMQAYKIERVPNLVIECATLSQESALPYTFAITSRISLEKSVLHALTLEGCELMRSSVEKENAQKLAEVGSCK